jgi:hypothetical protein
MVGASQRGAGALTALAREVRGPPYVRVRTFRPSGARALVDCAALAGDGRIGDGRELVGSMTVLSSGQRARKEFVALRELDAARDGRITPLQP